MATIVLGTTRFNSGKYGTSFQTTATEASVSHLFEYSTFAGDNTTGNPFSCYIDYIQMGCNTAGRPHIRDGSGGNSLIGSQLPTVDTTDAPGSQSYSQEWDFRGDPLVCLTAADSTSTIIIDMTSAGFYSGFVKYWSGPPPK